MEAMESVAPVAMGERSSVADFEILGANPAGELVALADGQVDRREADQGDAGLRRFDAQRLAVVVQGGVSSVAAPRTTV